MQLMLEHFKWIGDDGDGKMEENSKESYSSLDEKE